jgi:hypothetical protein
MKQTGSTLLIIILLVSMLILVILLYLQKQDFSQEKSDIGSTPKEPYEKVENKNISSKSENNLNDTFVKCQKDSAEVSFILEHLPEDLRDKTSNDKGPSKIYDINPVSWSDDCKLISFRLELVGRGGGAYKKEDFKLRGLYILNNENYNLTTVKLLNENQSIVDSDNYLNRSYWIENKFIFTILTHTNSTEIVANHYSYDIESKTISPYDYN